MIKESSFVRSRASLITGFAIFFALVLNLQLVTLALADSVIVNGNFGTGNLINPCNLSGWDFAGNVSVVNGTNERLPKSDSCVAKVAGDANANSGSLAQTFTVPATMLAPQLRFTFWARSDNGGSLSDTRSPAYLPQTVILLDARGNEIYSKSRNVDTGSEVGSFKLDLTPYRGQSLTLVIKVSVDTRNPDSPATAAFYLDKVVVNEYFYNPGEDNYAW